MSDSDTPKLQSIILCQSCDVAVSRQALPANVRALCPRCHSALYAKPFCTINGVLALCITALLLYIPANFYPVLELHFFGSIRTSTVWEGAYSVIKQGYYIVGIAVALGAIVAPAALLVSILLQVLIVKHGLHKPILRKYFRSILKKHLLIKQFSMPEIYVISMFVTAFNLGDFADIYMGIGTFCYVMLFILMLFLQREYNIDYMWEQLHESQ
ncbi:paraquat-inducible protein A [Parashewanella curva]|uniref:Paraquat-inducible protein A n=1 Tax=Parashewanella curva TaxID=2338552 RepID=A0A3L8PXH5_9GAMM|nr:paraquat-inducible protein A [Parashewanella curva]RLV60031.1 paraquat-inducible protein A [Parashewanella curva]